MLEYDEDNPNSPRPRVPWVPPVEYHARKKQAEALRRAKCRMVARAAVDALYDSKKAVALLIERDPQSSTNSTWNLRNFNKWFKKPETAKELRRLESRAKALTLYNVEQLSQTMIEALYLDRSKIFDENMKVKPFDEWPEGMKILFEGITWKTPKGQPPIAEVKLVSREAMMEKIARSLGMYQDVTIHKDPDGSAHGTGMVREMMNLQALRNAIENGNKSE